MTDHDKALASIRKYVETVELERKRAGADPRQDDEPLLSCVGSDRMAVVRWGDLRRAAG